MRCSMQVQQMAKLEVQTVRMEVSVPEVEICERVEAVPIAYPVQASNKA